jgi:hypothetical protein
MKLSFVEVPGISIACKYYSKKPAVTEKAMIL